MKRIVKYLARNVFFRYVFIGGTSYAIELGALYTVSELIGLGPVIGVALSFWIGLIVSFLLQKYLTFQDRKSSSRRLFKQSVAYGLLVVFNYGFTILFVYYAEPILQLFIARTLALIITTLWNFIIYSKIIFKQTPPPMQ